MIAQVVHYISYDPNSMGLAIRRVTWSGGVVSCDMALLGPNPIRLHSSTCWS